MKSSIRHAFAAVSAILLLAGTSALAADPAPSPAVIAALASPTRSAADKAIDEGRKAAAVAAFTTVKPGDKVADIFPGGGYFTRIFAQITGPKGSVYAVVRQPPKDPTVLTNPAFPTIRIAAQQWEDFRPADKLDVIFNSQFHHDLYNPEYGSKGGGEEGVIRVTKAFYDALKPGGVYVIVDHAGLPGTGHSQMDTLHRIEESEVKKVVIGVGFKLEAESDVLHNPADPKTAAVFDPSIRGKTDQFMLRFRKPK